MQGHEKGYQKSTGWLNHGGDIYNRRYAAAETKISPSTAPNLHLKWEFKAGKDISATPAICDGVVYFPSWNGFIYAVKTADGSLVWRKNVQELTGLNPPTYMDEAARQASSCCYYHVRDQYFSSRRALYIGVSSVEEGSSFENCCTFRGSFVKLDIETGAILWQTFMIPDNHGQLGGYAGAAVWGSSPSVDARRKHVYIATGNLYSVPQSVEECQKRQNNQTVPTHPDECIGPDIHFDSMLALDLNSGEIKWNRQLGGYDVWFVACSNFSTPNSNCPPGPSPDADFGEAPMMLSINANGTKLDIVVAVQKSGFAWALDRNNGDLVWSTEAGPGGAAGGGTWGAATDKRRVYTAIANGNRQNVTLVPSNNVTAGGFWVAMDAHTGRILWSTATPNNSVSNPVTIANGVLFAGSIYRTGPVYAINGKTGEILWSYDTGGSVYGGLSVSEGCIYVGNGYAVGTGVAFLGTTAGTSLFAFCID
ncbi:UNVERIFIED_CONTAM: Polyvinylalcohol dehydrogenase [Sesamum radiatum]|uniref:Polyvinylalcohol dehydrogenase n=1 Tax=Sesamum radiatum TaxID=300843 RepID=A0AAW2P4J1_SESRA